MTEAPLFTFRVLVEYNPTYSTYVARCLETGSVATAVRADTAEDMIRELLRDELKFAIATENLKNLFSSPAPIYTWICYRRATLNGFSEPTRWMVEIAGVEIIAEANMIRMEPAA